MVPTFLYKWLAIAAVVLALVLGAGYKGYSMGAEHQQSVYAAAQAKANKVVEQKNVQNQTVADTEAAKQVIYKDRIVTKYQTITKDVIKYVETPAATVGLDPEFVRLHNNAARSNDALPIAQSTGGTDGETPIVGVTTGEAIATITENYQRYYTCARELIGWQEFYTDLQKTINEKDH